MINKEVSKKLEDLKEIDKIIYSPDFQTTTFDKQREMILLKKELLKKISFYII